MRLRGWCRGIALGLLIGGAVTLCLAVFCGIGTARFVFGAERLHGTVVALEQSIIESIDGVQDFRPVVEVEMPSGEVEVHRFSGLYRVSADAVGQSMPILYNPNGRFQFAPDSPWNWIGSAVYGTTTLALILVAMLLAVTAGRSPAAVRRIA